MASQDKSTEVEQLELHLKYSFEEHVNFKTRTIRLNRYIDEEALDLIDAALTELESHNRQPITIRITSEGGDAEIGLGIVGRMKRSKCRIITEGYGRVQSAATLIFAAGNKRLISKYCIFMWHEALYDVSEGRHAEVKAKIAEIEREEHLWAEWMAEFSKKPKKFYYEEAKHTDKYWSPEQLVEFGIADEII